MQVYRHHSQVAITPPNGPTFYLHPAEAARIADYINAAAEDIDTQPSFYQSDLPTRSIEIGDDEEINYDHQV